MFAGKEVKRVRGKKGEERWMGRATERNREKLRDSYSRQETEEYVEISLVGCTAAGILRWIG